MSTRDEDRTRIDVLVEWLGWHLVELVAVAVPLLLAVLVSPWLMPLAVVTGGAWLAHEVRLSRRRRAQGRRSIDAAPADESVTEQDDREGASA